MSLFEDRLIELRESNGLSQNELCEKIGLHSRDTLSRWERGLRLPKIDQLKSLCEVLGCDSGYLMGEYDERHAVTASICEQTGLSELAVDFLLKCRNDSRWLTVINRLLETPDLLFEITASVYADYGSLEIDLDNVPLPHNAPKRLSPQRAAEFANYLLSMRVSEFVNSCRENRTDSR